LRRGKYASVCPDTAASARIVEVARMPLTPKKIDRSRLHRR
jgi:hypothetical protein